MINASSTRGRPVSPRLSPSDCLCIYLVCTGGVYVRSGSFKHCSKIYCFDKKRHHFTEKEKKKHKLLSRSSVRSFPKRHLQSPWLSHLYISTQKTGRKNSTPAKRTKQEIALQLNKFTSITWCTDNLFCLFFFSFWP